MNIKKIAIYLFCCILIVLSVLSGYSYMVYSRTSSMLNNLKFRQGERVDVEYHKKNIFMYDMIYKYSYYDYVKNFKLTGDERVLDFGCGTGFESIPLAEILSKGQGKLDCLDISGPALDIAKLRLANFTNIKYILGDITKLNLKRNGYDIIVIHNVLHDIDKQSRNPVVKTLFYLLAPGGKMYIRELIEKKHGIETKLIEKLMTHNGFKKISLVNKELFWAVGYPYPCKNKMCEGIFKK